MNFKLHFSVSATLIVAMTWAFPRPEMKLFECLTTGEYMTECCCQAEICRVRGTECETAVNVDECGCCNVIVLNSTDAPSGVQGSMGRTVFRPAMVFVAGKDFVRRASNWSERRQTAFTRADPPPKCTYLLNQSFLI